MTVWISSSLMISHVLIRRNKLFLARRLLILMNVLKVFLWLFVKFLRRFLWLKTFFDLFIKKRAGRSTSSTPFRLQNQGVSWYWLLDVSKKRSWDETFEKGNTWKWNTLKKENKMISRVSIQESFFWRRFEHDTWEEIHIRLDLKPCLLFWIKKKRPLK